jgi:tetratricopeptide (TPR) repeat protein
MTKPYRTRRLWLSVPGTGAHAYYPVSLCTEKALLYRVTGRWQDAEQLLRTALGWAERSPDRAAAIGAICNLSGLLIFRGALDEAQGYADSAIALCRQLGERRTYSRLLEQLGTIHECRGQYDQAITSYRESLAITEELGDMGGVAHTVGLLGVAYYSMADYDNAMTQYRRQLVIAQQLADDFRMSIAYGNMGNVYIDRREFPKALECHQLSLHHSRIVGDKQSMSFSIGNIAIVHQMTGNYDLAMAGHRQQLAIASELGDRRTVGAALVNLGLLQFDLGEFDQADTSFGQQLAIAKEYQERAIETFGTYLTARVRMQRHEYEAAERLLQQAIATGREIKLNHYLSGYLQQLAALYHELGRHEPATTLNDEALEIARKTSNNATEYLCRVLGIKLQRVRQELTSDGAAAELRQLIEKYPSNEYKGPLLFEAWKFKPQDALREQALQVLRDLYRQNRKYDYQVKIDELAAAAPS